MAFTPGTFLVISDIHSNIEALEAVLADAEPFGPFESILCPGDIVGYGPDPIPVIERLAALPNLIAVQGNHDEAVLTDNAHDFKEPAAKAVHLNRAELRAEHFAFLEQLRNTPYLDSHHRFAMVHGNFDGEGQGRDAYQNRYAFTEPEISDALCSLSFEHGTIPLGIFGHTHLPFYALGKVFTPSTIPHVQSLTSHFIDDVTQYSDIPFQYSLFLPSDRPGNPLLKVLVNPGSVGQPRNRFPDAHYAILLFEEQAVSLNYHKTPYDVQAVQTKLRDKGYPEKLATRLADGT